MRRLVAAAAAEAVIGRQDMLHLEGLALLEAVAAERERHGSLRDFLHRRKPRVDQPRCARQPVQTMSGCETIVTGRSARRRCRMAALRLARLCAGPEVGYSIGLGRALAAASAD